MKKLIYPIALVIALITVSAFSIHHPGNKCTKKESKEHEVHSALHAHDQVNTFNTTEITTKVPMAIVASESLPFEMSSVEIFVPSFQLSDDTIENQFNREETTIETIENRQADLEVNEQFYAENEVGTR